MVLRACWAVCVTEMGGCPRGPPLPHHTRAWGAFSGSEEPHAKGLMWRWDRGRSGSVQMTPLCCRGWGQAGLGRSPHSEVYTGAHVCACWFRRLQTPGSARVPVCPRVCVFMSIPTRGCTFRLCLHQCLPVCLWPCLRLFFVRPRVRARVEV